MITYYMTLTLALLPAPNGREVLAFKDYDTVQEACAAAKKFMGEDLIARVDEISAADCCENDFVGTPWIDMCKKDPARYVCDPTTRRIVETLKCKVTPAAVVYTAEKLK